MAITTPARTPTPVTTNTTRRARDDFPQDEPHSPAWLPLLGGGLFLAAIFAFVLIGSDDKAPDVGTQEPAKAAAAPAAAQQAQRPVQAFRPGTAVPPGHVPVSPRPAQ